jgi:hypothetical protein
MFKWIARHREQKEAKLLEATELLVVQEKVAEHSIAMFKAEMLERTCPVNNNDKCSDKCIHFCNGYTLYVPSFNHKVPGYWHKEFPKCRLWCSR